MKSIENQNESASKGATKEISLELGPGVSRQVAEWETHFFTYQQNKSVNLQRRREQQMQDEITELQEKLANFIADNYMDLLSDWQRMDRSDRLLFYRALIQKIFPESFIAAQDEDSDSLPF